MSEAWSTIEQIARYYGPDWVRVAAKCSALGYRFTISRARPARPAYADWPAVVRYAYRYGAGGFVDNEWLAAMCWYSGARLVTPNYHAAQVSTDPRLRDLAKRTAHRYGSILAPVMPWHALESAPLGGRWDDARWVALLAYNDGPYSTTKERL